MPVLMKKGRAGTRLEVLAPASLAEDLEAIMLAETTTIGVRHSVVRRRALSREQRTVRVLGFDVGVKVVRLPDGSRRTKPEYDDVHRVALATGRPARDIFWLASVEAERD
jgi:pyridinium-3,5-bisthiocarboxylic acid mononucleotide nickel chelatase